MAKELKHSRNILLCILSVAVIYANGMVQCSTATSGHSYQIHHFSHTHAGCHGEKDVHVVTAPTMCSALSCVFMHVHVAVTRPDIVQGKNVVHQKMCRDNLPAVNCHDYLPRVVSCVLQCPPLLSHGRAFLSSIVIRV